MPNNNYLSIKDPGGERPVNGHAMHITERRSPYELRSEEVQDIMTKMPAWIIRQGTTVLFAVIILLFAGAYFIRFPDIVTIPVQIKPVNTTSSIKYVTTAALPSELAGKVKTGQQVIIKLPLYPFHQFGIIEGRVAAISVGHTDTSYKVSIQLVNGLLTSMNKEINPGESLSGTAEVLTSNETILERVFQTIR